MLVTVGGMLTIAAVTLTTVDRSPLIESDHYLTTVGEFDKLNKEDFRFSGDTLKIGWAKVNLTPSFPTSLAGYGISNYKAVVDSIWMRAFVFDNGRARVALLAPDLLIFPPEVKKVLLTDGSMASLQGVFFTATHTHHSIGNWHPGLVGRLFAGPYDQNVVDYIARKALLAINKAVQNLKKTRIAFSSLHTDGIVYNRIDSNGGVDPFLRIIKFVQNGGETALIASFSAHSTTIPRDSAVIHRDYPGALVKLIEKEGIDFGAFIAGAVGSQGPVINGNSSSTETLAEDLSNQIALISNLLQPQYNNELGFRSFDIEFGEPQFRISENVRIRPWLFKQLFGEYVASMQMLRIGDIVLLGTPCDFSGELVQPLDQIARNKGMNLMVSSFNGDYIGYITRDDLYNLDSYETRTMNWFGPENGKYFSQLLARLIEVQP